MIQVFDFAQGDEAWHQARLGIPTASRFKDILASSAEMKMRRKYMYELAGERIRGEAAEGYTNGHMERGTTQEDDARRLYAFLNDVEPEQVGFIRNGNVGSSPDSLIGDKGGLEIKSALPHIQIERLLAGRLPPEHKAQVQGNLWVSEREWWDFMSYCPKMKPLIVRVTRDDDYIRDLERAVADFSSELHDLVERLTNGSDHLREALKSSIHMAG